MHIILRSLLLACFVLPMSATVALAEVRYADPDGSASAPCTTKATPCALITALNSATSGDDVELAPGDYIQPTALTITIPINVYGEAGKPRPVIRRTGGTGNGLNVTTGATLSYVELTYNGVDRAISNGGTVSRSRIISTNTVSVSGACEVLGNYFNSICISMGGHGFYAESGGAGVGPSKAVRNSVGVSFSSDPNNCGLSIEHSNAAGRTFNFINSALEGSAHGVCLSATGTSAIILNLTNSNYRSLTSTGDSGATRVVNDTGSLQGVPGFVNQVGQDFHPAAGSPLIDAGLNDPANGALDFDGKPRTIGAATDIGAFESDYPPPVIVPPALPTTISTKQKSKSKSFTAAKSGAAFQLKSKQPKKKSGKPTVGTLISFTLNQADDVNFTLERASEGRKSGSKCVKKTKSNKSKKKCPLYKRLSGTEKATGLTAGPNTIWWTGRWNKKKLAPGSYALRGTPIKASTGNEPGVLDPRPVKILPK
jgi:hypothetical protein